MATKKKTIIDKIESNMDNYVTPESNTTSLAEKEVLLTIQNSIQYFESYVFPIKVEIIKQKYLNAVDRTFQMKKMWMKNRSNRIYPLIASVHDTFVANLHEVETVPRVVARKKVNQEEAPVVQWWYDWARDVSSYNKAMMPIRSEACLIWTSYGRSWFKDENKIITRTKDGKANKVESQEIKPTIKHISFFQLFYDPFCDEFDNCPWKAYRYITNLKDVAKKYAFLFEEGGRIKDWKWKIKWSAPLSNYDYTRIYSSKNYEREILKLKSSWDYDDWVNNKLFTVAYSDQDLVEVIEYREDDQLILFINGVKVYDWDSPYPFTWDPFSVIIHEEVPWQIQGIGIGDKLMNHQINANTLFSWLEDAMRMHLYPMYKAASGALTDSAGRAIKKLTYEPERVVEDKSKLANWGIEVIKWIDFNAVNTFMQRLQAIIAESYEIVWLNTYTQWGNGKMERSAQWVTQKAAIIRTRLLSIIESLNSFNARVFNQWLAIWLAMFPETFNYRVIGEDWEPLWNDIKLEDVVNKFDIVAESDALRWATKELKASQAMDALSKMAPMNLDPLTWLPIYHMDSFMEEFMEKFDFPAPKKYTEQELTELVQMKQRIEAAAQPPASDQSPETMPTPMDAAPVDSMTPEQPPMADVWSMVAEAETNVPSDIWMLSQMQI